MASANATREHRKIHGLCIECGIDTGGKFRCDGCKRKNVESQQRRARRNWEAGLCRMCGQRPVENGFPFCGPCRFKANKATKKHAAKREREGRCLNCGKPSDATSRCSKCLDLLRRKLKAQRDAWLSQGLCRDCGKPAIILNRGAIGYAPGGKRTSNYCRDCFLKMTAGYVLGTRSKWPLLLQRLDECNWECVYTGEKLVLGSNLSFDHADPVCRFPEKKSDPKNLDPVTLEVNLMKRHMTKEEFLKLVFRIRDIRKE